MNKSSAKTESERERDCSDHQRVRYLWIWLAAGYADLSQTDGVVKIGSTSQAQKKWRKKGFTVTAQVLSLPEIQSPGL